MEISDLTLSRSAAYSHHKIRELFFPYPDGRKNYKAAEQIEQKVNKRRSFGVCGSTDTGNKRGNASTDIGTENNEYGVLKIKRGRKRYKYAGNRRGTLNKCGKHRADENKKKREMVTLKNLFEKGFENSFARFARFVNDTVY